MSWAKVKKAMVDATIENVCDLGYTPHLFIYVEHPYYTGAMQPVNEMSILRMSVGVNAVIGYSTTDEKISFRGRVDGVVYDFEVPYTAVFAVGTKEDDDMYFQMEIDIPEEFVEFEPLSETIKEESEVIEMCPGAEAWRNPNARADWASSARLV